MRNIVSAFSKNIQFQPSYAQETEKKCISTTFLYDSVGFTNRTSEYFLETKKQNDLKFLILTKNYKIQNHLQFTDLKYLEFEHFLDILKVEQCFGL